jgi:hypothetical protein
MFVTAETSVMATPNWRLHLGALTKLLAKNADEKSYIDANVEAIEKALGGQGPDASVPRADAGARVVFNISASHIPAFCTASRGGDKKPYKNGYDLGKYHVGDKTERRVLVDSSLPIDGGPEAYKHIYFAAAELNGAGVRFYGDFCLVLKPQAVAPATVVLDRNSYDLIRRPLSDRKRPFKDIARDLHGHWDVDFPVMATIKILQFRAASHRRLTTGQVSDGLLEDEDYVEVLKIDSFRSADLQEVRTSAADAALGEHLSTRLRTGPVPRMAELLWLVRRRKAEQSLRQESVMVRVVTTTGRIR